MKINTKRQAAARTHEGAPAIPPKTPLAELRRAVLSCLLYEKQFYESGEDIATRIANLVPRVPLQDVCALAIDARTKYRLRHVPLLLMREVVRSKTAEPRNLIGRTLTAVIQRADEISDFLALYWKDGKTPLAAQVKLGLAGAFAKFDAYQLAKYRGEGNTVRLRDALFLVHAKPNEERTALYKQLADDELETPDTWEVALSGGADKREAFERLLREGKLGYMALLRNLRNMEGAGVDATLIRAAISAGAGKSRALPFRFIAAAKAAPRYESQLDAAMQVAVADLPKLQGVTALLVDVSGSMNDKLSAKSELTRMEAASALAILAREMCQEVRVFAFSNTVAEVPDRRGMALADAIHNSVPHGGTDMGLAVRTINAEVPYQRLIVLTDEQSATPVEPPTATGYMVNVASAKNGIGYGDWQRLEGFSEAILTWISEYERSCEVFD